MTNETNGISLRRLKTFLTNLKNIFAEKNHSHATSDITGLDTSLSSKATFEQGRKADSAVQSVKIGTTEYKSGTTVTLPSYPTSLPASDVYDWAKASSKPSYTKDEVGLGNVGNFKAVSTVASQGLTDAEKSNARANISAQVAGSYASANHNHDDKYQAKGSYASASHTHDDRYYTESEIDSKLSGKANSSHTHTIANITNLQSTLDGKAASNHTHSQYLTSHQDISGKFNKSGDTITGGTIAMSKTGLPTLNGSVVGASNVAIGKNGIGIMGIDTSNDGAAIFMENGGTETNRLIIGLGDDATQNGKQDYIAFRYYDTAGNVTYESKVPNKSGTIALTSDIPTIPSSLPANGGNSATVNGHTVNSDVPANAKFTDTTYGIATTSTNGLMSKDMVTKLNGITSGANMKYKEVTQSAYSSLGSNYEKGTVYFINN